jgi:hypothetical protein
MTGQGELEALAQLLDLDLEAALIPSISLLRAWKKAPKERRWVWVWVLPCATAIISRWAFLT